MKGFIIAMIFTLQVSFAAMAAPNGKVLVILSGVDFVERQNATSHPTGWFLPELATPAMKIQQAQYELVFANPSAEEAAMDGNSDDVSYFRDKEEHEAARAFIASIKRGTNFESPELLSKIAKKIKTTGSFDYEFVFFPGGHAPMQDLYKDPDVGAILEFTHAKQIPTAAICHAPVVFAAAKQGTYSGYTMTIFSNEEEKVAEENIIHGKLLFSVEDLLKKVVSPDGKVTKAKELWAPNTERHKEVITGQNPGSHHAFADLAVEALVERRLKDQPIQVWLFGDSDTMEPGAFYDASQDTRVDWSKGFITVYLGKKLNKDEKGKDFRKHFTKHVNDVNRGFGPLGLKGYLVLATDHDGIAYHLWDSEKAFNDALASPAGKLIGEDIDSFLETLLFKPATRSPLAVK